MAKKAVIKKKGVKSGTKRGAYKKKSVLPISTKEKITLSKAPVKKTVANPVTHENHLQELKKSFDELKDKIEKREVEPEFKKEIMPEEIKEPEIIEEVKEEIPLIQEDLNKEEQEEVITEEPTKEEVVEDVKETVTEDKDDLDSFDSWKKDAKKQISPEEAAAATTESEPAKKSLKEIQASHDTMFNVTMLISMLDFLVPRALKWYYKQFKGDKRVNKLKFSDLKLTDEQIESLGDSTEVMAEYIFQYINPIYMAGVGLVVMYDSNMQTALDNLPKE